MKRLVLLVEGHGDVVALPELTRKALTSLQAWDALFLDPDPIRVGDLRALAKDDCDKWKRALGIAQNRGNLGACLLLLDGDLKSFAGRPFCPVTAAREMARAAREAGAGETFSAAVVFARCEFESWLIAGYPMLVGQTFADGRKIKPGCDVPPDPEAAPRDAKGWWNKAIEGGYLPTRDQCELARLVNLDDVRSRGLRSFRRFESAVASLAHAVRCESPVATPAER